MYGEQANPIVKYYDISFALCNRKGGILFSIYQEQQQPTFRQQSKAREKSSDNGESTNYPTRRLSVSKRAAELMSGIRLSRQL